MELFAWLGWPVAVVCLWAYMAQRDLFAEQAKNAEACLAGWKDCIVSMCEAARRVIALEAEMRRL
jgi:hypothetical protein